MEFTSKSYVTQPEILKRKLGAEYTVPVTLDFTSVTANSDGDFVVKAGTPINASGVADNTATAIGILLSDTYKQRPVGTLVKGFAVINTAVANANSGLTIADAVKTALSKIIFE